jgi:hypothetical protein
MKTQDTANQIRDRIKKYFNSVGVNTVVTRYRYDAENNEVNSWTDTVKAVYEIRLDRLVAAPSTSSMVVKKGSTKSEVTLETNVVVSNPPMTGQW